MAQDSFTPEQLEKLAQYAGKQLGKSPAELKAAFEQGGLAGVTASLSPAEAARAEALIGDKEKAAALLNSPAVQQLLQQLLGGK